MTTECPAIKKGIEFTLSKTRGLGKSGAERMQELEGRRKNARAGRACGDQKDHGPPGMSWLMHCGTPRSCDTKLRLPCNRKAGGTHGPIFP